MQSVPKPALAPAMLYRPPPPAPCDGSERLHVFLSVQIEDESLESTRQPVRVVWRGCLLAFSFSFLLFLFFYFDFSSFL